MPAQLESVVDQVWLPGPPRGASVCGGFDGSFNDDWTAIKLETRSGFLFTPRWGHDKRPAIWNPAECPNHEIPRNEVTAAWREIAQKYRLMRVYADPGFRDEMDWSHEIESEWPEACGVDETVFVPWVMAGNQRRMPVYKMLRRFEADLKTKQLTHDGCPITTTHVANATKIPHHDIYVLGKPAQHQKIDVAVTSLLAHEAAADQRSVGWADDNRPPPLVFSL